MEPPDQQQWQPPDDVPRLPVTRAAPGARRVLAAPDVLRPAVVGGAALAVLAAGLVAVVVRGGSPSPAAEQGSPADGACLAVTERELGPPQHRTGRVEYDVVPPDSGEHNPMPLASSTRLVTPEEAEPLVAERAVHNLEHGYVILWYDPDRVHMGALRARLFEVSVRALIAVPWDRGGLGDTPYVLTAWGHAQECTGPPPAAVIEAFYADHGGPNGDAPEKVLAP